MNQKQPYELTITEKLEQLTVPDMVDAIWARIETQLDIDMPTDDGPTEPPATPTTGPGKWINAVFFIALLTILFTKFYNQQRIKDISNDLPTINTQNAPVSSGSPPLNISPDHKKEKKTVVSPNKVDPPFLPDSDSTAVTSDDPDKNLVLAGDSMRTIQPITGSGNIPPASTEHRQDTAIKKQRGVKGINDADYRIVPKKDSGG